MDDTNIKVLGKGIITEDPKLFKFDYEKPTCKTSFFVKFKGYRDTVSSFLFEVWDSAAIYIVKNAKAGDTIEFEAVPKNYVVQKNEEKIIKTKFRISTFKLNNEKDTSNKSV